MKRKENNYDVLSKFLDLISSYRTCFLNSIDFSDSRFRRRKSKSMSFIFSFYIMRANLQEYCDSCFHKMIYFLNTYMYWFQ